MRCGGWAGSFAIALLVCLLLLQLDLVSRFYLAAIEIATTALGPLMPILQDSGQISTRFGSNVLAVGAVGEFFPLLLLAVLFNESRAALLTALAVVVFLAMVAGILFLNRRAVAQGRNSQLGRLAVQTLDCSAQFGVRISILLPIMLAVFLLVRGLPVMFGYQRFERRLRIRLALVAATQLPLVLTIMERLVDSGNVPEDVFVAIIGAAIISVSVFPIIGFAGLATASGKTNVNGTVGTLPPIDKAAQS